MRTSGLKGKKQNNKLRKISLIIILLAIFIVIKLWGNDTITSSHYRLVSDRLPAAFDGYKIAQISDLHNAEFGENNSKIIKILQEEKPNIIVITGDLVDSNRTDMEIAMTFIKEAVNIAPCYYVTGNHEAWIGDAYKLLEEQLLNAGVTVLHDEVIRLAKDKDSIQLIGLDDPDFIAGESYIHKAILETKLHNMDLKDEFKLLLSHRPEIFDLYAANDIDLVLSGHAHGGQFRLPFIGGLVAPNQGFFPKYDGGLYHEADTSMIVSRGIGNSIIPLRINNRPEVVIVDLHTQ